MKMKPGETWREFLCSCALAHDTSMARAMLRALGVPVPHGRPRPGAVVRADRYAGVAECFENRGRRVML